MRHTFQVNMNFGDKGRADHISAFPLGTGHIEHLTFAQNIPTLLRRIKTRCKCRLQDIVLEFQPEN